MPNPRVKFDKQGKKCPTDMNSLVNLPDCGFYLRKEFVPQVNPRPKPTTKEFNPFEPGNTLPTRIPRGLPGIPNIPSSGIPSVIGVDKIAITYPQDNLYPLPNNFLENGHMQSLALTNTELQYPTGYQAVSPEEGFEMDAFDLEAARPPRTRLFEESRPSIGTLRRRELGRNFTPESNFTGQAGRRHQLDNAFDSTGEFATETSPLLGNVSRRSSTLRIMEQARTRATNFATNRAAEIQTNARTLARAVASTAEDVQIDMARSFTTMYRQGFTDIGRAAQLTAMAGDIQTPSFTLDPLQPDGTTFRDGTFEIEQGDALTGTGFNERVTGIQSGDIESAVFDENPFEALDTIDIQEGRARSYTERIGGLKDVAIAPTVGSVGVGLAASYGVGYLMGKAGADPYSTAFVSGATGDVAGRYAAFASEALGKVALQKFGIAASEAASESIVRQLAISGLRGTAEGGIAGLALAPIDIALNQAFLDAGLNNAEAGASASAITGTAFLAGTAAVSLATAPETLGMSVLVGGIVAGIGTAVSAITGAVEDGKEQKEREDRQKKIDKINNENKERKVLIALLPSNNYNLDSAKASFKKIYGDDAYNKLDVDGDTWSSFSSNVKTLFTDNATNPSNPDKPTKEPSDDDKKVTDLYQKYVAHNVIAQICGNKSDCALKNQDPGSLSDDDSKFLDDKAGKVWKSQADLAVSMNVGQANFHHQLMATAQQKIYDGWNKERKLPKDFDEKTQRDAQFDKTFMDRFNKSAQASAQSDIIQGYITSRGEKTIDKFSDNVREMALSDPTFKERYNTYINNMKQTSFDLNVTIPQLIDLQSLGDDPKKQQSKYKEIQFDNAKENVDVVAQAQSITTEEEQISKVGFYDIDSAFLQTDPTKVGEWRPTDAQIILASRAGMTLQQYVDYLTQLAKGDDGDFSKLPTYNDAQLTAQGELDFHHLQDDLQLAGYSKDFYIYDPKTRTYSINPNVAQTPDEKLASDYQSQYSPEYLVHARNEYATMITNLNNNFSDNTDAYNKALRNQLHNDALTYYQQMQHYNIYLSQQSTAAQTPLMTLDTAAIYNANAMHFHPLSTTMPVHEPTKPRQLVDHHGDEVKADPFRVKQVLKQINKDVTGGLLDKVGKDLADAGFSTKPTQTTVQKKQTTTKQIAQPASQPTEPA